jgi:hypothetical protein
MMLREYDLAATIMHRILHELERNGEGDSLFARYCNFRIACLHLEKGEYGISQEILQDLIVRVHLSEECYQKILEQRCRSLQVLVLHSQGNFEDARGAAANISINKPNALTLYLEYLGYLKS